MFRFEKIEHHLQVLDWNYFPIAGHLPTPASDRRWCEDLSSVWLDESPWLSFCDAYLKKICGPLFFTGSKGRMEASFGKNMEGESGVSSFGWWSSAPQNITGLVLANCLSCFGCLMSGAGWEAWKQKHACPCAVGVRRYFAAAHILWWNSYWDHAFFFDIIPRWESVALAIA